MDETKRLILEERAQEIWLLIRKALESAGVLKTGGNEVTSNDTWIRELFDTYVVICKGTEYFAYPYVIDQNDVVSFGDPVKVEEGWIPIVGKSLKIGARNSAGDIERLQKIHDLAVENGAACESAAEEKSLDPETLVHMGGEVKSLGAGKIGGYLVKFTDEKSPDLSGDFFTSDTYFGDAKTADVYYQHGIDKKMKLRIIGKATLKKDEFGIWAEAQLADRDQYEKFILGLAGAGKLGWSSGTAQHLVERKKVGNATWIKHWPLGLDATVTPTPCEPTNAAVPLKSLIPVEVETDSSEAEGDSASEAVNADADQNKSIKSIKPMETKMDEQLKTEVSAIVADAVKEAMKAVTPAPVEDPKPEGALLTAPAVKKVTELGFSNDAVKGFLHWAKTGDKNGALIEAKGAWQGQTDSEGGYLVPDDFHAQIIEKRNPLSWVRRAGVNIQQTSLDVYPFPIEDTAMTKFVVTAEEGSADENEPTFGQARAEIYRLTKLVKASVQVLADNKVNLEAYLSRAFGRAAAAAENYYFTVGTGTGMPQGVLTGATSSAITTAGATAITAAEMVQLRGKLGEGYQQGAIWLTQFATLNYLQGLTGNPFQFIPTPQGDDGTLLQRKAITSPDMEALAATKKAVLYGNPEFYGVAERQGMAVQRLVELYAATGQVGFLAALRIGGVVLQAEAWQYMTQHA